ncbi:hypothetical protein V6N13_039203 [Hibiscus sabdariffa]
MSTLATLVYASPNSQKRKALWKDCAASARPSKAFRELVFDHGLRDMGFSRPDFTWSRGMAQVRLDRVLCNSYWDETYPESMVHHLFRMKSDHRPIMLSVGDSDNVSRPKQFRYFSGWLSHDDFPHMVQDNWHLSENIVDTVKNFAKAATVWNDTVFGYIGTKKRMLMARLRGIQKALCISRNHFLISLENSLLLKLETVLDQEELLWRQKSRSDWIMHGDHNTSYFHRRATCRKQKNRIWSLKLDSGDWVSDESSLKNGTVLFFKRLFSIDQGSIVPFTTRDP